MMRKLSIYFPENGDCVLHIFKLKTKTKTGYKTGYLICSYFMIDR